METKRKKVPQIHTSKNRLGIWVQVVSGLHSELLPVYECYSIIIIYYTYS